MGLLDAYDEHPLLAAYDAPPAPESFVGGLAQGASQGVAATGHGIASIASALTGEPHEAAAPAAGAERGLTAPYVGQTLGGAAEGFVAPALGGAAGFGVAGPLGVLPGMALGAGADTWVKEFGAARDEGLSSYDAAFRATKQAGIAAGSMLVGGKAAQTALKAATPAGRVAGTVLGQEAVALPSTVASNYVRDPDGDLTAGLPEAAGTTALITAPAMRVAARAGMPREAPVQGRSAPVEPATPAGVAEVAPPLSDLAKWGVEQVETPEPSPAPALAESAAGVKRFSGLTKLGSEFKAGLIRPARVAELLDGGKPNGPWTTQFYRPLSDASYAAKERNNATNERVLVQGFKSVAEVEGVSTKAVAAALRQKVKVGDGPDLTGSERVGIALAAVNDRGKLTSGHLTGEGRREIGALADDQVDAVIQSLTPVERGVAQVLAKDFKDFGPEVSATNERLTGQPLDLQDGYYPNHGLSEAESTPDTFASTIFGGRNDGPTDRMAKSFTKEKSEAGRQSLDIDALGVWQRHSRDRDYFLEMAEPLANARSLLAEPEVAKQIDRLSVGGNSRTNLRGWLNRWLEDSGRPNVPGVDSTAERAMRYMRTRGTAAVLAGRPTTILKQPVSMLNAAGEAGYIRPIIASAAKTLMSQRGLSRNKVVQENSRRFPEIKNRTISREVEDIDRAFSNASGLDRAVEPISGTLLQGLRLGDKFGATSVADAVYRTERARNVEAGMPMLEAERVARERTKQVIERTQNDARTVNLPQWFRDPGEVAKFLTIFGNEMNQALNTGAANARKLAGGNLKAKDAARYIAYGVVAPAVSFAIINRAFNLEGAVETLFDELVGQTIGLIPGGSVTQGLVRFLATGDSALLDHAMEMNTPAMAGPTRAWRGVNRGLTSKAGFDATALADIVTGAASTVGLPGEAGRIAIQGFQDGANPFFSRYQRRPAAGQRAQGGR